MSPTRRSFLKSVLWATASLILPRRLLATERTPRSSWFLHSSTGDSWAVADPVAWCLENARQPILERARERLVTLTSTDSQRIIRLVTRRCQLNLIEIQQEKVVVQFWGQQGPGELRPFFKKHGLARKEVEVVLLDRKHEKTTLQSGDDFLYGEPLLLSWPLNLYCVHLYRKKWQRRFMDERGDGQAAPYSWSNYCWEGVEQRSVPWRVLKSAWRHEKAPLCRNCDKPMLLTSFGYFVCGFYKRGPVITRICPLCRRQFDDHSPWQGPKWMMENLDDSCLPSFDIMYGKSVTYTLPWTPEGQAHDLNRRVVDCLNRIDRRGKYGSYYLCDQKVVFQGKNGMVPLPPFDGPEDRLEEWCRFVVRLMPTEG